MGPLPSVPPRRRFHSDTILRCPLPLRLSSFLLSPGMIFRCPFGVFSLPHASLTRIPASFSVLRLRRVLEAHLEGRGIPIMVVEEVIEIFMVSSASRNFDATDIHWSCVIIYRHFFLPAFSIFGRIRRRKETSDAAREKPRRFEGVIFLYCTGR